MLITLPKETERWRFTFDWDFLSWEHDRKRTEEKKLKKRFQNKSVSSQNKREKEEGAAVDSSAILPYLFSAGRATVVRRQ